MSMETDLRARLKDDGSVAGLVGTKVDWTVRPQKSALPAITLQMVSEDRSQHMGGFNTNRATRIQVDCWGATRAIVVSVREAAIAALVPAATKGGTKFLRAFVNNIIDRGENADTGFLHRDLIDLTVWHN